MKAGDVVLIDTNVIIEAHRVDRWRQLSSNFSVHTVEKVIEETQTGYQRRTEEQQIDQATLKESCKHIFPIGEQEVAQAMLQYPAILSLDPGERDLLIYASMLDGDCWLISSPDSAAMRVAHLYGWLDRVVSLEVLLEVINCQSHLDLKTNYTKKWDESKKSQIILGIL